MLRVALHIALLRSGGLPISMLPLELCRDASISSRGSATAPAGLRGELFSEQLHRYAHHSAEPDAQEPEEFVIFNP